MILTLLLLFLLDVENTTADAVCKTPHGQDGYCVSIKECSSVLKLLDEKPLPPEVVEFVRNLSCGFNGTTPKVCCPRDLLPDTDICGLYSPLRPFGGKNPDLYEFPWVAMVEHTTNNTSEKVYFCDGVLISKRYVLTTAACIITGTRNFRKLEVRLGEFNVDTNPDCVDYGFGQDCTEPFISLGIEETIIHENYSSSEARNDFALIRLKQDVAFSDFIQPICLPKTAEDLSRNHTGKKLFMSGWGEPTPLDEKARIKLKEQISVISRFDCGGSRLGNFTENQLCAGREVDANPCVGYSGGPLMVLVSDQKRKIVRWYLAGVKTVVTRRCMGKDSFAVFTNVAKYMDWIVSHLRP